MMAFCKKYSTLILLSFLGALLALAWAFPAERLFLGITFVLFSFFIASLAVLQKHREAYRAGRVRRGVFLRHAALEITGTGLAMALAGWLGRQAAQATAGQIDHALLRVAAGMAVGLLVGIGVGTLARWTWGRLVRVPAG